MYIALFYLSVIKMFIINSYANKEATAKIFMLNKMKLKQKHFVGKYNFIFSTLRFNKQH